MYTLPQSKTKKGSSMTSVQGPRLRSFSGRKAVLPWVLPSQGHEWGWPRPNLPLTPSPSCTSVWGTHWLSWNERTRRAPESALEGAEIYLYVAQSRTQFLFCGGTEQALQVPASCHAAGAHSPLLALHHASQTRPNSMGGGALPSCP